MVNNNYNEANGISEAMQTWEAFNATVKEVRDTFEIEKYHEEQ